MIRCRWHDAFAKSQSIEGWFSEEAVCLAHSLAVIGRELSARGLIRVDWSLLDWINDQIAKEENVGGLNFEEDERWTYSVADFTKKAEDCLLALVRSERYEAVPPVSRIVIPILEKTHDYEALVRIYDMLQAASTKCGELKKGVKRHLGTYFRVVLHGKNLR